MTEYLFQEAFDHLNMGVFIVDKDTNYIYVNPAYAGLAQYPVEFFKGMSLKKLSEKKILLAHAVWDDVVNEKKAVHAVVTVTDTAKERIYDLLTTATPVLDENKEIRYVVYVQEPLSDLSARMQEGLNNKYYQRLEGTSAASMSHPKLIAESPQMQSIISVLKFAAPGSAPVLLSGPTGSGKEVLANFVHENSPRAKAPFVVLNCAAIPETLFESELFGYEKGAFTGASSGGKVGLVEAADGGTLFIDEINSMPVSMQIKLLRVLETKTITRIGSTKPREIDFRLVCASNEDLPDLIREKKFRSDLYYRINVINVTIPPLTQRKEDIYPLALHYVEFFCRKYSCAKALSPQIIACMEDYAWPGNVRELRNMVERMIATSPYNELEITAVPAELLGGGTVTPEGHDNDPGQIGGYTSRQERPDFHPGKSYRECMDEYEKAFLTQALQHYITPARAARELDMDLSNLYRKIKKYNIGRASRYAAD